MEQNLVFRNDQIIKETTESFARLIPQFQAVIDQFSDLQIGKIENKDEILQAVRQPEKFILGKMTSHLATSDQPTFGGFKLQPEKLCELLDVKEKTEFLQSCKGVTNDLHYFELIGTVKKGRVESDPKLVEQFIRKNEIFAVTEKEKIVFQAFKNIRESLQAMFDAGTLPYNNWQLNMNVFLTKDIDAKNFELNIASYQAFAV